jgi:hypothetical protein
MTSRSPSIRMFSALRWLRSLFRTVAASSPPTVWRSKQLAVGRSTSAPIPAQRSWAKVLRRPGTLHLAYFTGCAMWTFLTVPFLLNEPGFITEELDPWREDGETWRRLRALFPNRIACHNPDQVFYFGPDGLLRRHDYNMEVVTNLATADYTDDHQVFGGISFPTLRRAVGRQQDGTTEPEPALFTIDIADLTVASRR